MAEHTLLLNASFEPLDVVDWRRAMTLWAQGKVEIIETHDREVRAITFSFKLPSIVRLFRFVKPRRRPFVQFTRANIYTRDNYTCQYCYQQCPTPELTFDHVVPVSRGGARNWQNIVTCCVSCNRKKSSRTPDEAGMTLLRTPSEPAYTPMFRVTIGVRKTPDSWRDYIYWSAELDHDEPNTT